MGLAEPDFDFFFSFQWSFLVRSLTTPPIQMSRDFLVSSLFCKSSIQFVGSSLSVVLVYFLSNFVKNFNFVLTYNFLSTTIIFFSLIYLFIPGVNFISGRHFVLLPPQSHPVMIEKAIQVNLLCQNLTWGREMYYRYIYFLFSLIQTAFPKVYRDVVLTLL